MKKVERYYGQAGSPMVYASDYDALLAERDELLASLSHISDLCKLYVDSGDSMHSASIEKLMDFADEAMSGDLGGDV